MGVKKVLFFISYGILMLIAVSTALGIVGVVCALFIIKLGWWGLLVPALFIVLAVAAITTPY